jgi:hypothetical protein
LADSRPPDCCSYGFKCLLLRDLTQTALGPSSVTAAGRRVASPDEAGRLMVRYFERFVMGTAVSEDVAGGGY